MTERVRQSEATRTLIAYSLYQSVITLDTLIKFSATGTHAPEILVFLAQVSQYSFFAYHQLTSVEPSEMFSDGLQERHSLAST